MGGASRDSTGFVLMEEGLISRGGIQGFYEAAVVGIKPIG